MGQLSGEQTNLLPELPQLEPRPSMALVPREPGGQVRVIPRDHALVARSREPVGGDLQRRAGALLCASPSRRSPAVVRLGDPAATVKQSLCELRSDATPAEIELSGNVRKRQAFEGMKLKHFAHAKRKRLDGVRE